MCSPLFDDTGVYVQAGGAFEKVDKKTGKVLWQALKDGGGTMGSAFSSPVFAKIAGTDQVVGGADAHQTRGRGPGHRQGTVAKEIPSFRGMNILTPVPVGDDRIFTSTYGGNTRLWRVKSEGGKYDTSDAWTLRYEGNMSTPVVVDGHTYVLGKDKRLLCVNVKTGKEVWGQFCCLPAEVTAAMIAEVYRGRWRIEGAFHELEAAIRGEVETLGHPKAALFAFCAALVAFNVLRVVKAAIGAGHGIDVEVQVSGSDLAEEIAGTRRGMAIAVAPSVWSVFARMGPVELAEMLRGRGRQVWRAGFRKQPRGPKKPRPPRESGAKAKHYATARLLQKRPQK